MSPAARAASRASSSLRHITTLSASFTASTRARQASSTSSGLTSRLLIAAAVARAVWKVSKSSGTRRTLAAAGSGAPAGVGVAAAGAGRQVAGPNRSSCGSLSGSLLSEASAGSRRKCLLRVSIWPW